MKQGYVLGALGGVVLGMGGAALAWARRAAGTAAGRTAMHRTAEQMSFTPIIRGASRAVLWGDPYRGAYAAFTRFEPGASHPLHRHPNDIMIVVLSGAYVYNTAEGSTRVGPRSFFFLPAGVPHTSGGDPLEGCLFFETSSGKFGLELLEKPTKAARAPDIGRSLHTP
jgi:mannose-6-phosphate isomerase-like protein (cupin superfamily)